MGEAIQGINEIFGLDMECSRRSQLSQSCIGLGPPDLILVVKEVNGLEKRYYHHVYGISHRSQSDFIEYFEWIRRNMIPLPTPRFVVKYAVCYTYDVVSQKDCVIPSKRSKLDVSWRNLHLSSVLRSYRHDSPLLYSIFGGTTADYGMSVTIPLFEITYKDLEFAAEVFSYITATDEHQLAIARALLCTQDTRSIMMFLHKYSNSLPNVPVHIAKLMPPNSVITEGIYFWIERHLDIYSDDIESVFAICSHYLDTGKAKKCSRFIPLLMQAMYKHPQSAICLARICTAEKRYVDAFSFLNIAALSKGWQLPTLSPVLDRSFIIFGNPYPMHHSELEKKVVDNPVTGRTQAFFEAIDELIISMGAHEFMNMASKFAKNHKTDKETEDCPEHPFYFSDTCISKDEFFLFDPGVDSEAKITDDLSFLPYSKRLQNMIKKVFDSNARMARLYSGRRTTYKGSDLLLAVRMKDGVIANSAFEYLKANNKLTAVGLMLMFKAALLGIATVDVNTPISLQTMDQENLLRFVRGLVQRLMQIERV